MSMVKYKLLKKHIKSMGCKESVSHHADSVCECSICLETSHKNRFIVTKCGHTFHPFCLIKSLEIGPSSSCPMCRRPAGDLVLSDFDGKSLQFLAMLQVNIRAMQFCHSQMIEWLKDRTFRLRGLSDETLLAATSLGGNIAVNRLERELEITLSLLETTIKFASLNYDGFRKILKKFDKNSGLGVSPSALADIHARAFVLDISPDSTGPCQAIQADLLQLLSHHRQSHRGAEGEHA